MTLEHISAAMDSGYFASHHITQVTMSLKH